MRGFRIRTLLTGGVGPLAEPLGSSALDAARAHRPCRVHTGGRNPEDDKDGQVAWFTARIASLIG